MSSHEVSSNRPAWFSSVRWTKFHADSLGWFSMRYMRRIALRLWCILCRRVNIQRVIVQNVFAWNNLFMYGCWCRTIVIIMYLIFKFGCQKNCRLHQFAVVHKKIYSQRDLFKAIIKYFWVSNLLHNWITIYRCYD